MAKYTDMAAWDTARKAAQSKWEKSKSAADRKALDRLRAEKPKGATPTTGGGQTYDLGVSPTGQVDVPTATKTITEVGKSDTDATFNMMNPGTYTDANGNVRRVVKNPDGTVTVTEQMGDKAKSLQGFIDNTIGSVKPLDLSGVPKVLTADDLMGTRQSAYDALYRNATQYLQRDRSRDMEDARQQLANRGIPIDLADQNSAWGRATGAVDEKYRQLDQNAQDRANEGADSRLATLSGVNANAANTALNQATTAFLAPLQGAGQVSSLLNAYGPQYGAYAGGQQNLSQSLLALLGAASGGNTNVYGINKDYQATMAGINKAGSGGGQKSDGGGFVIAGAAP